MKSLAIVSLVLLPMFALAEQPPRAGAVDPRIRTLAYRQDQVYALHTHPFQETMVIFSERESIIHVGLGDPLAWNVVPINNYLSVKPIEKQADTNLNVLTQHSTTRAIRSYAFSLDAGISHGPKDKSSTFMVRFTYPEADLNARLATQKPPLAQSPVNSAAARSKAAGLPYWNRDYSYSGSAKIVPTRVIDDGQFTYFRFSNTTDIPAIFLLDDSGEETLVNQHVSDNTDIPAVFLADESGAADTGSVFIVVHRLGKQFVLRGGSLSTCIFNQAYPRAEKNTTLQAVNKRVSS